MTWLLKMVTWRLDSFRVKPKQNLLSFYYLFWGQRRRNKDLKLKKTLQKSPCEKSIRYRKFISIQGSIIWYKNNKKQKVKNRGGDRCRAPRPPKRFSHSMWNSPNFDTLTSFCIFNFCGTSLFSLFNTMITGVN